MPSPFFGGCDLWPQHFPEDRVITIEPFLSTRSRVVVEADDGWTLVGAKGNRLAQFEHTLIVTRGDPIVVTVH
ncbi:hypothetical protein [Pseudoxanthomonas broegbernensis]|uniref:hypothetical protein n=1 Tax=Pseudoxanthomonas broegbernensis TaxID=83619 RepID=UPI00181B5DC4|nr:hypothetical protein [Pseudoxanthomonas broegbernensis]MBB6063477.1 methionine aminopeptidase [Pseudoxanthomonas broegbernensis]